MTLDDMVPIVELVKTTGRKIAAWRQDTEARKVYSPTEFKTEADRRAHDFLIEGLQRYASGIPVISEEDRQHDQQRPLAYWLIDPIDGTASWYEGYDGFVCQAAYIENGRPTFGVIHAPVLKKTWFASAGMGAWQNGERLDKLSPSDRLVITDNYPEPRRASALLCRGLPVTDYIESGSIGLKGALVANGTADLFVKDIVVRDWDIAPLMPLLAEVGGIICKPDGETFAFTGSMEKPGGVIVSRDRKLADRAVSILAEKPTNEK